MVLSVAMPDPDLFGRSVAGFITRGGVADALGTFAGRRWRRCSVQLEAEELPGGDVEPAGQEMQADAAGVAA